MSGYFYPIRLVSPIQLPGAPPLEVRPLPVLEYSFNIGTVTAGADYWTPVIDLGNPRYITQVYCAVRSTEPMGAATSSLSGLASDQSMPYSSLPDEWLYCPMADNVGAIYGVVVADIPIDGTGPLSNTGVIQFIAVARYVQIRFLNGAGVDLTGMKMLVTCF